MIQIIMNALFSTIFFISAGTILDTKFKFHKYDKENYRILFDLKNNESGNPFCIKHDIEENIKINSQSGWCTKRNLQGIKTY